MSALGFDKKVYAGFSENSCTMAELLEKTNMRKKERVSARQPEKQEGTKKKIVVDTKHEENQEDTDDFYKAMQDGRKRQGCCSLHERAECEPASGNKSLAGFYGR